jgi:hypothetical protein
VLLAAPLAAAALIAVGLVYLDWPATIAPSPPPALAKRAAASSRPALSAPRLAAPALISPATPFVLQAAAADRAQAEHCLAQAVYYEAADQGPAGEAAVAQTVINRLRHPDFPKSVCGVVYEGAALPTGCQYSFTCDGSLRRSPDGAGWRRALEVARRALSGYVETSVGWATHYHADYVSPYWAPRLVKLTQIGAHIFYRWPGAAGDAAAFVGRYAGHEAYVSRAILTAGDPPALLAAPVQTSGAAPPSAPPLRSVTLDIGGKSQTYQVNDAGSASLGPTPGVLTPSRPHPTPEQVAQINAMLASGDAAPDKSAPPAP